MNHLSFDPTLLIPILGMLIPLVAIIGYYLLRAHRLQLEHDTLRKLAESGQPIPPELLRFGSHDDAAGAVGASSGMRSASSQLRAGAINTGLGLGLMVFFYFMQGEEGWLWAIGAIPLCIGVAMLVVWKVERGSAASKTSS